MKDDPLKEEIAKYGHLTIEEWAYVKTKFSFTKIAQSEFFLKQDATCHLLGFVLNGFLRTYTIDDKGNEITTHFAYDHSFAVSFYSFKNQMPSFENIVAVENTQLLTIGYEDLQKLFKVLPKWEEIYRKIIENSYACMEERNYILQNLSASKKYELLVQKGHPSILQKALLGHIASYLGIKQETLSRVRKNLL